MKGSIHHLADHANKTLQKMLPGQRKTQRDKLAVLIGTMLEVRSANTMELAAALPIKTERLDMRYQWVSRFLANPYVRVSEVMRPFAEQLFQKIASKGPVVIAIDQTQACFGMQILMVSVRFEKRALPIAWIAHETEGGIGFSEQSYLLKLVASYLPVGCSVRLLGDRFYGTAELITFCEQAGWDYRLRLKSNLKVSVEGEELTIGALAKRYDSFYPAVRLTSKRVRTNVAFVRDADHPEPWSLAMKERPSHVEGLKYAQRWSIEAMFSDFKSRGFGLEDTQLRYPDRLERLLLVMSLRMWWAVVAGEHDRANSPMPYEKKGVPKPSEALSHSSKGVCDIF